MVGRMLQQKILSKLMLLLFIFSSPYLLMSEGTNVTCVAPTVKEGQPGKLTCNFNLDISKLDDYIATVEFYRPGQNDPIQIIECHVTTGPTGCSGVTEGYTFDGTLDSHLRLDMINVSTSNVGSYMCKLSSTKFKPEPVPCSFNIADATTPSPGSRKTSATTSERVNRGNTASPSKKSESEFPLIPVAVGAGAAVIVTVVVVITIIICRRKRQQSQLAEDAEFQKLTDPSVNYSKSAVSTKGKSAPDDENPPPIPERVPILQDMVYDDQRRGEDGDEQPINAMSFPATEAVPPPKPPRSYEILSQETQEDDAKVMSAAEKEEADIAK